VPSRLSPWGSVKLSGTYIHKYKNSSSQLHCLNPYCRFTYWWSNAGTSTLGSVHHSNSWPILLRTSWEHTNCNRLCSSLSLTKADLSLSLSLSLSLCCSHSLQPQHFTVSLTTLGCLCHYFKKRGCLRKPTYYTSFSTKTSCWSQRSDLQTSPVRWKVI